MSSNSDEIDVSDDLVELIQDIIIKNNWEPVLNVEYLPGSEAGDGYASKHVAINIIRSQDVIRLFAKYALDFKVSNDMAAQVVKFYSNETYFYKVVHPAYTKFLNRKNIQNGFHNVPRCYGASPKNVIVLENLKTKGFVLFGRGKIMDDNHITLVLKIFARFHATSFAFKDQCKEEYSELIENWDGDYFGSMPKDHPASKMFLNMILDGLSKLDPIKDKEILERCDANVLNDSVMDVMKHFNEYSIITQGDCWCNNIMFLHENGDRSNPIDAMLVDWQLLRPASPVFDVSYFFYTIATEESLNKLDSYLEMYYDELCKHIRELGSDPEVLYPKSIFEKEWKQHCKYGFAMAFALLKFMLANRDEVPKMDNIDFANLNETDKVELFTKFDNEEEYVKRLRTIAQYVVDKDYV